MIYDICIYDNMIYNIDYTSMFYPVQADEADAKGQLVPGRCWPAWLSRHPFGHARVQGGLKRGILSHFDGFCMALRCFSSEMK